MRQNKGFCFDFLAETNMLVIDCIKKQEYKAAVGGIDRIINGLITLTNSGEKGCKELVAAFSYKNAEVILFSLSDENEKEARKAALANFEDARDFTADTNTASRLRLIIGGINNNLSVDYIRRQYAPDYPESTVKELEALTGELKGFDASTQQSTAVSSQSSAPKKTFKEKARTFRSCLTSIIVVWILAAILVSALSSSESNVKQLFNSLKGTTTTQASTAAPSDNTTTTKAQQKTATVLPVEGLNLRKGPGTEHEWIMLMNKGTVVTVEKTENGWAYVSCNGVTGWCSMEYLELNY